MTQIRPLKHVFLGGIMRVPAVKHDTILCKPILFEPSLDNEFVWDWSNSFWLFSEEFDGMSFTWLLIDSLDIDVGASGLGVLDGSVVGDNTIEETLTRFGVSDVFNADIDTFWDDTSTNLNIKSGLKGHGVRRGR